MCNAWFGFDILGLIIGGMELVYLCFICLVVIFVFISCCCGLLFAVMLVICVVNLFWISLMLAGCFICICIGLIGGAALIGISLSYSWI